MDRIFWFATTRPYFTTRKTPSTAHMFKSLDESKTSDWQKSWSQSHQRCTNKERLLLKMCQIFVKCQVMFLLKRVVVVVSSSVVKVRFFGGDVTLAHSPVEWHPAMQLVCRPPAFRDLGDQDDHDYVILWRNINFKILFTIVSATSRQHTDNVFLKSQKYHRRWR